jgi:Transposase zinc-binding domain/Putative transposase
MRPGHWCTAERRPSVATPRAAGRATSSASGKNACRHRCCPPCTYRQIEAWLRAQLVKLLPCEYFHVVFTLPEELRLLWRWNPERMAGMVASLHTWSRTLVLHPRVYLLVTGGGPDA